jgi:polysaccharide export outer membrane protein
VRAASGSGQVGVLALCRIVLLGMAVSMLGLAAWAQPAAAPPAAPGTSTVAQYRLAAGDSIRVFVYQNPDLSLEVRLTESGTVSFPLLGTVSLAGLSVTQAEKRIADGLRDGKFVKQPQVSVSVVQVRGNQVSVLGQVGRPGRFPLETGEVRLTDLLAMAGGIAAGGADTVVVVGTRNSAPFRTEIDLPSVFAPGKRGDDVILRDGDVIWVERQPVIYLYGEVQRPGTLRLERSMTVLQALAAAGGVSQRGTEKGMRVHRKDDSGEVRVIEPKMTDFLKPNDVVFVRESLF